MEENKNPLMGHVVKVPAQVSGIPDGVQMTVNAAVTTFAAVDGKPAGIESMGTAEWVRQNAICLPAIRGERSRSLSTGKSPLW